MRPRHQLPNSSDDSRRKEAHVLEEGWVVDMNPEDVSSNAEGSGAATEVAHDLRPTAVNLVVDESFCKSVPGENGVQDRRSVLHVEFLLGQTGPVSALQQR